MRTGFVTALAALLAGAGLVQAAHTTTPGQPAPAPAPRPARLEAPEPDPEGVSTYGTDGRSPYMSNSAATGTAGGADLVPSPTPAAGTVACGGSPYVNLGGPEPGAWASDKCTWFRAEYLLWHISDSRLPPLAGIAPRDVADQLQLPEGAIIPVLGGKTSFDTHSGIRLDAGRWFGEQQRFGIEAGYFQLEHRTLGFQLTSAGDPILGPVFNDPGSNQLILLEAGFPGSVARDQPQRTASMSAGTDERLWGVEANFRVTGPSLFSDHTDFLIGFRHINFDEGVGVNTVSIVNPTVPDIGGSILATGDSFRAHNRFYGAQIGFNSDYRWRRLFWNLQGKLGIGGMHENVNIQGATAFVSPTGEITVGPGGVLTQPTNIGQHDHSIFTVVPEINLNVGFEVTPRLRAYIGYTFLYIDHLARVGNQIDFNVDRTQVQSLGDFDPSAPAQHPAFQIGDSHMWAHGLNFGVDFRF